MSFVLLPKRFDRLAKTAPGEKASSDVRDLGFRGLSPAKDSAAGRLARAREAATRHSCFFMVFDRESVLARRQCVWREIVSDLFGLKMMTRPLESLQSFAFSESQRFAYGGQRCDK